MRWSDLLLDRLGGLKAPGSREVETPYGTLKVLAARTPREASSLASRLPVNAQNVLIVIGLDASEKLKSLEIEDVL